MLISKLSRSSRLSSRQAFSRDPEGFARYCGTIDEQTFQYPSSRVILSDALVKIFYLRSSASSADPVVG